MQAGTLPPRRILAALDFDDTAGATLAHATAWARAFDAALTILHVTAPDAGEADVREARAEVDAFTQGNVPGNLPMPERLVRSGHPADVVVDNVRTRDADLIIMGSHGRGLVGRVVLGSVASDVVRRAGVPVLLVRAPGAFIRGGTIVVATDLGDAAAAVVGQAARLAETGGASLHLLHVLPIGDHESPGHVTMRNTATLALQELRAAHVPSSVSCDVHVTMQMEEPAHAVAHYAREQDARLLVVGGHGSSRWTNLLLGNITQHVLHDTPLPVLVVPHVHEDA